jgi:hypothetical protein
MNPVALRQHEELIQEKIWAAQATPRKMNAVSGSF